MSNVRAAVRADMAEQMAVVRHNRRWLVRLGLVARRPMPVPLWPRTGNSVTVTLAEFVLARITEDEAVVQAGPAYMLAPDDMECVHWDGDYGDQLVVPPAQVLADCAAKRQLVEREKVPMVDVTSIGDRERQFVPGDPRGRGDASPVLRLLALPYASHPDYRPEWSA